MGALEFLGCLLTGVVLVTFRRLLYGPLLPRWSWGYEVITTAQKRFHERVATRTPQAERRAWSALQARGAPLRKVMRQRQELGGVRVTWFTPAARSSRAVMLYLHGGGFMYGSERSHGELCARLALRTGARVALIDYRLAPEHPFPAALDDALEVYTALIAEHTPPSRLVVAGDSAGGNLALALLLALRERGVDLPASAVLISPWVDLSARDGSLRENSRYDWASPWMFERWARAYLGKASADEPLASPARAHLTGLPPLLVTVGTAEMLYDQVVTFVEAARGAGVEVSFEPVADRVHLWLSLTEIFPEFESSFGRIADFIDATVRA